MRSVILSTLLALATPALASPYFPLVPGAIWTLEDDDPAAAMSLTMASQVVWHGAACYPRYETVDGDMVGTTYWSADPDGRVFLHGMTFLVGDLAEFYFSPPAVYLDPSLQPGESISNPVNVYQAQDPGDHWHGEFAVDVTCIDHDPVATPLGTFVAVAVDPAWNDSPFGSPWRYGHDGIFNFGYGVGPVRITSYAGSEELLLVQLDNFVPTVVPATVTSQVELRAAPNPFNPATVLRFELPSTTHARLEIFDLRGRRIDIIHDGALVAGPHQYTWQPRELGSGIYLARITTREGTSTTRLTLIE